MEDTGLVLDPPTAPPAFDVRSAVADAVSAIVPPGHRGALVAVVDAQGQHFLLATRLGETWTIAGAIEHRNGEPVSGRVMLSASW